MSQRFDVFATAYDVCQQHRKIVRGLYEETVWSGPCASTEDSFPTKR